ncbi:MAG: helix-turn-helix domain-containing protein [Acidobacteriota bacterium]|nr:helix-turn-helix domain-containing protein [Acidobacteriota bacterium]MDH3783875.1 helix-turn-helix domain-containing protein [Acidobacteriota bacterium]
MQSMTLREAAEQTSRSVTTLRRYIRSGRLHAEKRYGRFGPEYFVSEHDLSEAGLELGTVRDAETPPTPQADKPGALATRSTAGLQVHEEAVPRSLFETLQMKHEQLLVQYGMVRAGGLRYMELSSELEAIQGQLEESLSERQRLAEQHRRKDAELRQGRLKLESAQLELAAAREKIQAMEMLTRNSATSESIEEQFSSVMERSRRIRELDAPRPRSPEADSDH